MEESGLSGDSGALNKEQGRQGKERIWGCKMLTFIASAGHPSRHPYRGSAPGDAAGKRSIGLEFREGSGLEEVSSAGM